MNIILTGITGNLGYEVARVLLREGHNVIPIIRSKTKDNIIDRLNQLNSNFSRINKYILADLEQKIPTTSLLDIDCVIHCAGVVHFRKAGNSNEQMMNNLLSFIRNSSIPIYYVSTAYLYKPHNEPLFNQYEVDKYNAEAILTSSYLPYTIFRPSIITGNSKTGEIIHFSGYYLMVSAFVNSLRKSNKIKFPSIKNQVNIIPVDWVARSIVDVVKNNERGTFYITNSDPPTFDILLKETLRFFNLDYKLKIIECLPEYYKQLDLSNSEKDLFNFCAPFLPYLTTRYNFPSSLCVYKFDANYITVILDYFNKFKNEEMEQ